ncbi:MAG TPA: NAD(P)-binding protein [Myxococcaceae bacterium]|nr:NAD(P)-binding protein [Myxococcaceae bacterium]
MNAVLTPRPRLNTGPSRHIYDVIALGGQLGGALAAALLAKRGYRVLLVDHDGLGHGYEHDGFILPYAPFVAPPLKTMPVIGDALLELGLNVTIQRATRPHKPELQLVFDKHRLDLSSEPERRRAELVREFGGSGAQVGEQIAAIATQHEQSDAFVKQFRDLPPNGVFGSWRARRELKRRPEVEVPPALSADSAPAELIHRLLPFLTWLEQADTPLARTRPLSQVLRSPSRLPGGHEGLRDLILKKLIDLGGDVLSRDTTDAYIVEELSFEGSKLVGVQVLQSSNVYRGSSVIAATDSGALRRLITDKKSHRDLIEVLDLVRTKKFLYSVNWVVPAEALPRPLGELVLVDTGDELGTLLVQLHGVRRATGEDDRVHRVLCAGAFVPASVRDLGEAKLQALKKQIETHLDRLVPFVRQHLALSSAPYLDAGGVRGSRLLPHPLLEVDVERFAGVTGLSPSTPLRNLFLASREVFPGLGLEGELLAGVRAARLVHELLQKKSPLKR